MDEGVKLDSDDLRVAVGRGVLTESQAAALNAVAQERAGLRGRITGYDEPFELFRGFNEVFIVVGLAILYVGWLGLTGPSMPLRNAGLETVAFAAIGMGGVAALALYFTRRRRMLAPSSALTIMFVISAAQLGLGLAFSGGPERGLVAIEIIFVTTTVCALVWFVVFRIPFAAALTALGVFVSTFVLFTPEHLLLLDPRQAFLLSGNGPYAIVTIGLGIATLVVAMIFDMSDPHRVTRRAATGLWLHIIAAPAIVNTVALTLLDIGGTTSYFWLLLFVAAIALFAIVIDRRSFLVAAIAYVVALSFVVFEEQAMWVILSLGILLVALGAFWDRVRAGIMRRIPRFAGKDRLPPWDVPV